MRAILQKALRWHDRSKEAQEALHKRFDTYRYWRFFSVSFLICLFPMPLKRLFTFTLSDKEAPGKHHYGWAYQKNFRPFKYGRTKILDIGIGGAEDADPALVALAKKIKSIEFHHNLIFFHKGPNDGPSNVPFIPVSD